MKYTGLGLEENLRRTYQYYAWRESVRKRDKNKCIKCHSKAKVHVHHIIGWSKLVWSFKFKNIEDALKCKELWSPENGICLCRDCHKKEHKDIAFL